MIPPVSFKELNPEIKFLRDSVKVAWGEFEAEQAAVAEEREERAAGLKEELERERMVLARLKGEAVPEKPPRPRADGFGLELVRSKLEQLNTSSTRAVYRSFGMAG